MSSSAENFFQTLTPEIFGPLDFVDWNEIDKKIKPIRREIGMLEGLDLKNPSEDLAEIIAQHPKVLLVLKLLVGHTPDSISFRDGRFCDFKADAASGSIATERAQEIASMFIDMKLVDFLSQVKSVLDLVKGVYVGLLPNTRKSSRGKLMESVVSELIETSIAEIVEETSRTVEYRKQLSIAVPPDNKKVDNLILLDGEPRIAIETNFYSTAGSKPSETLQRAYPDVQTQLRRQGMDFIVVTDGAGWLKMKPVVERSITMLHNLMNLEQARSGELKKAIMRCLRL